MSFAQGNNTPNLPRIEPGSPDPESDALTTRPVRPPCSYLLYLLYGKGVSVLIVLGPGLYHRGSKLDFF